MPSAAAEAASSTPEMGLAIKPTIPFPTPLKNPLAPYFFAPLNGYKKTPVIPFATPEKMDVTPWTAPSTMCFGFFDLSLSLS